MFCKLKGAMTMQVNGRIIVVGVLSMGTSGTCEEDFVSSYTRISNFIQWIRENSDVSEAGCSKQQRHHRNFLN